MQCFTWDPILIEIMGLAGFDWMMLDSEHWGKNLRAREHLIRAAECVGLVPFVMVTQATYEADIHRTLEAGAKGIFLPEISSVEDVKKAADAAFFPHKGNRGICPAVRAAHYNDKTFVDHTTWNNSEILLVPMTENPNALADLEGIWALPYVYMIVFAAGDLGFSLNERTGMLTAPKVSAAYKRHNVAVIDGPVLNADAEGRKKALRDGITIFSLGLE
jgi:2-keto-3-deoxy-L-rhamnonate aldolase RhmA